MRRILLVFALVVVIGGVFSSTRFSYDRGYARGFEQGAVEATSAAGEGAATVQVISPDRYGFHGYGPGPFLWPLFPLTFLAIVLLLAGGRRGWRGGWGPGGDPRDRLERWHERAHAAGARPEVDDHP